MRTIYFEPAGAIHSTQWSIIRYPPSGYRFLASNTTNSKPVMGSRLVTNRICTLGKLLLTKLIAGIIQSSFAGAPKADLIHSYNRPVFRHRPRVAYLEWFKVLLGRNAKHSKNYRWFARRVLATEDCKATVSWPNITVNAIVEN